jgi:quercetin dioxygenase-like cupin family protein
VTGAHAQQRREFLGIPFDLLATGDRLMVTRMRYETGMTVPAHTHEHEQAGYVVSGRYRQTAGGETNELGPGDSYAIPGGIEHGFEVLEGGLVIDVFTPPREEFR